ncbi:MAG: hypothetical protein KJ936_02710 [Proteobacteria bacterium]|nr:hypothetical protein [Pseudomonadota bacterium]MBU2226574.1 hypothetical protein [Pseudomonadota bacterium]MBU2262534.1 hypothetical protein [Pseudomonadota bacterium]
MSGLSEVPGLLGCREEFLARAIERLGTYPSDFQETLQRIAGDGEGSAFARRAAGVLLPLVFRGSSSGGQFYFQLIKRSPHVPQPGDLSCPGGVLNPFGDGVLRLLTVYGPFPILRGAARRHLFNRDRQTFRSITLFLTNALRESWEEIRLSPRQVRFLGPLPAYNLALFRRTIFPLAGYVESPGVLRPNGEVEKIVEIPLASFYREDLVGRLTIDSAEQTEPDEGRADKLPCLIHRDAGGGEEVLWGATFNIAVRFLEIALDYRLPEWRKNPVIRRTLFS